MQLFLNQRVRFRGTLCQVVAVTPAAGNTMYKLKHVESDKVLDGDFILDDQLSVVDPEDAAAEEAELAKDRRKLLADRFGEPQNDGDLREQKLNAIRDTAQAPPVPEAKERLDAPKPPEAPGIGDEDVATHVVGEEDNKMDYQLPEGGFDPTVPESLR